MLQLTLFGAADADLPPSAFTVVTLFGAATLKRPTLARRLIAHRDRKPKPKNDLWRRLSGSDRGFTLTVFGSCEILAPTLMEEYAALRALVRTGGIRAEEVAALIESLLLSPRQQGDDWLVLTAFGATERPDPDAKRERKALDAGWRGGILPAEHRRALEDVIGAPEATAATLLGRLAVEQPAPA